MTSSALSSPGIFVKFVKEDFKHIILKLFLSAILSILVIISPSITQSIIKYIVILFNLPQNPSIDFIFKVEELTGFVLFIGSSILLVRQNYLFWKYHWSEQKIVDTEKDKRSRKSTKKLDRKSRAAMNKRSGT